MANEKLKCPICGGEQIKIDDNNGIGICKYCDSHFVLPRMNATEKVKMFNLANKKRLQNQFDEAMALYNNILILDNKDSQVYWSLVLCRYGIRYEKDAKTKRYIPTINRMQIKSIKNDDDYKMALKYANPEQRKIYIEDGNRIDEVLANIIKISKKEKPFDIFICYKENNENGGRTQDSVLAQDIYNNLVKEGYRVFFSRVSLEDKLGTMYEPYIYSALSSAKLMIVVGTSNKNLESTWVKNEWSRYIEMLKGNDKHLIPVFKGMKPKDLPEEFVNLQGQDMSKIGAMQDLLHGVSKIVPLKHRNTETIEATKKKTKSPKKGLLIGLLVGAVVIAGIIIGLVNSNKDDYPITVPEQNELVVEFDANGGVASSESISIIVNVGDTRTLIPNPFTKEGYSFLGWSDTIDGEIKYLNEGVFYANVSGTKTLYAIWAANINTLIFNSNGGSGDMISISAETDEVTLLPANTFVRKGFEFVGWSEDIDGKVKYNDQDIYNMPTKDINYLYAVWEYSNTYYSEGLVMSYYSADDEYHVTKYRGTDIDVIIPKYYKDKEVTKIENNAFYQSAIESVYLPDTIDYIGETAFMYCKKLVTINLNKGLLEIGKSAFSGCENLASISIPNSVKEIGTQAFLNCSALESIVIPEGIEDIEDSTFENCVSLSSVILPESIDNIEYSAFYGCTTLQKINIPAEVKKISKYVFGDCVHLEYITLPEGITSIERGAFSGCSHLTSIVIPSSVSSIGEAAFQKCSRLENVTLKDGLKSIGSEAFASCASLKGIAIPNTVTSIGEKVFCYSGIKEVILSNNLSTISKYAFRECEKLVSVDIPSSITSIDEFAFISCSSLEKITFHEGLSIINYGAFDKCSSLKDFILPDSLIYFGGQNNGLNKLGKVVLPSAVLYDYSLAIECVSIEELVIKEGATTLNSRMFSVNSVDTIFIPKSLTRLDSLGCDIKNIKYAGSKAEWEKLLKDSGSEYYYKDATIEYNYK